MNEFNIIIMSIASMGFLITHIVTGIRLNRLEKHTKRNEENIEALLTFIKGAQTKK
jgi:hypothetical protein